MKITIKSENGQKIVDLKNDLQFNATKGEQYVFSNGFSNYVLNFKDNQESVILTFNVDGKSIKVELNGIVPLLQSNTENMSNPTAIIINKDANEKDVDNIVDNNSFDGGEIIDRLEALLSKPVELGNNVGSNLTLITDYQTLLESLGAAAAGGEAAGGTSNGSTFNSIFSFDSGSLADIADTARWENLSESISTIPVDSADTIASTQDTTITPEPVDTRVPSSAITLSDEVTNEGVSITITATVTNPPQTDLIITLNNGETITIVAGQTTGSTTFTNPNGEDVYIDNSIETYTIIGTTGGNYVSLDTSDTSVVTVKDTEDITTVKITGTDTTEGGEATFTIELSNKPQTGTTATGKVEVDGKSYDVTFDADGKATLTVDVKANDVYNGEPTLTAKVTEISGGNFEKVNPTAQTTITVKDTEDITTVKIEAAKVTDKVITKDNFENNAGFTVTAKNPDGTFGVIAKNGNPSGFGVANHDGSGENVNISGAPSEIGMTKDGKSESIEVEFKNPVHELNVAFAWRATQESAKVEFYDATGKVGHAIIFGGDGSVGSTTIQYYNKNGVAVGEPQKVQGGTDKVDLVYKFNPAGDVSFTKAVFSAEENDKDFGQQSDYLIHSISYKEVSDGSSTTIVGSDEVAFKISTSNAPDSSWLSKGNTPTADVKIFDKNTSEVLFNGTVNLDKDGNAIVTVRTDGTKDLKAEVSNVQGNFEKVDYTNAKTEVEASIKATASSDSFNTFEDTNYVLNTTDFGDNNQNVAKIQFNTAPTNGTIYVLKTEYTGSMNDKAEYSESTKQFFDEIEAGDIVDISQIENGNVVFVPTTNTDDDRIFNFSVSNGNEVFTGNYETTVNVIAVADVPTASIDITKIGATTIVGDGNGNESNSSGIKALDILKVNPNYNGQETIGNDYSYSGNDDITKNYQNVNATNITTDKGNDTLEFQSLNSKNINSGAGDDKVIINQSSSSSNIQLGEGNNSYTVAGSLNSGTTQSGTGDDTLIVNQGASNTVINLGDGNNTISIGEALNNSNISTGSGNDTLIVGQASDNNTISTGGGNDFVQLNHNVQGTKIDLGTGNDGIRLSNEGYVNFNTETLIDGGTDFDTLYLNGKETDYWIEDANHNKITYSQYVQENKDINGYANKLFYIYEVDVNGTKQGSGFKIKNVEDIVFEKDAPKEVIINAVEYKVDISASLKDTDGSETLSVVIKNVPTGAILESTKYDVSKNPDGSWNVNFKTGTTGNDLLEIKDSLTLKVPRSYKEKINLEIESKATESRDNSTGENFETATANDTIKTVTIEPFKAELDMELSSATTNTITTKDVNKTATEQAGIKLGADGKYYETKVVSETKTVVDSEALKDKEVTINGTKYTGITVGADGKYYVIDNNIAKEQKTIEVEREVTKTVSLTDKQVESFMIEVTKETKGIVLGKEVTDLGKNDTIAKSSSKTYTLEQPTSNIEIKLTSGSAKLEFVDANGKVIGSSTTQSGTDSKGYSAPKDAVGVKITSTSTSLKIDAIKYHVDPHEETVQVGGKILDVESIQKAGISWNSTVSEEKIQTQDITKLGSTVGDGNIKGFNPEAKANSQVFDFGKDKAYQLVTIKVDATISGTWNFNKDSTKDVFVVNANGVPQGAYNYTSSQDYSNKTPSQTTLNADIVSAKTNGYDLSYVNGTLNKTYEYKVYLDENGQVQMNFVVASTNTDEFVTVNNILVSYEGLSGFVQTKTEIEKVTETIFVGVPTNIEYKGEVPTIDITKYENVESETTPIYTKLTQYEYVLDLSASITDTDGNGELSNIITLEDIPNGVTIKGYEANENGTYTVEIGEDGKAQLTLISDSLLNDTDKESIKANITATDGTQSSEIKVNIDEKEESSQATTFDGEGDIDLTSIIGQYKVNYIDLENGKANDIKLDFDEILADDKEIYIKGDDKDSISLNSDLWKEAEATNVDGVKYNVYTGTNNAENSTIKLLIDDDIQVNHDI